MSETIILVTIWIIPVLILMGSGVLFVHRRCLSSTLLLLGSWSLLLGISMALAEDYGLATRLHQMIGYRLWGDMKLYTGVGGGVAFALGFLFHARYQSKKT